MDYSEQNAKIARIMGWKDVREEWQKTHWPDNDPHWETPEGRVLSYIPRFCEDNNLAAEFRQHTMRQDWFVALTEYPYCDGGICVNIDRKAPSFSYNICASKVAETEAAASSLACLAA